MNLLLQLYADLPDRFPEDERRVYVWACRKKTCRRKEGSVRGLRAVRRTKVQKTENAKPGAAKEETKPATHLGETLFGVKPNSNASANPFAAPSSNGGSSNPFASSGSSANPFASTSSLAAKPPQKPELADDLPQTFAQKARVSSPEAAPQPPSQVPYEAWPEQAALPQPYPSYHIDAGQEYIDPEPAVAPSNVRVDNGEGSSGGGGAEDKTLFESSMDKTFQKFADRLSQNPEQVLRYEFAGSPLLYSKTDKVGKLLAAGQENANAKVKTQGSSTTGSMKVPRCANCGAERVFELQLTPHAITELEADEISVDGMDWGTVILGTCSQDCLEHGKKEGEVGYVEEWIGVQWEELAGKRPA